LYPSNVETTSGARKLIGRWTRRRQMLSIPEISMTEPPAAASAATVKRPGMMRRLYLWVLHWAETPYGTPALFGLSFAESSFFPVPPDVLQIALSVSRPRRSFYYALVSGLGSVAGALLGWYIGYCLWVPLNLEGFFESYVPGCSADNIAYVRDKYQQNAFLAILGAAFTPIPFKVFTITAGMAEISLGVLLAASFLGRFARFFAVAVCIFFFGPGVKSLIDKYFGWATLVFFAMLVGGFMVIEFLL